MTDNGHRIFATWKLDWINALMIGVEAREFRVAVCLLQFANSKTRLIFPSQARIAALLGCSITSIERAIAKLVADGWLERRRPNRQMPNSYRFIEAKRDAMRDLRTLREDAFRGERWGNPDPAEVMAQDLPDPADMKGRDPAEVMAPDPAEVRGKHCEGTLEGEHYESASAEGEDSSLEGKNTILALAERKRSGPIPGEAILSSAAYQRELAARPKVDPFASLDKLEADIQAGRYRR